MSQRTVRWLILGLLLGLNLMLLIYQFSSSRAEEMVSGEQMEAVFKLYRQDQVTFSEMPDGSNPVFYYLRLSTADVDRMAERFLEGESYDKSYIYGSKVQYKHGSVTLLSNRPQHTLTYTNDAITEWEAPPGLAEEELITMLQPVARRFAENWLGEVYLSEWRKDVYGYRFVYRQLKNGLIYYFNSISLVVTMDGVKAAVLTVWDVDEQTERVESLPADEMLYAGLRKILEQGEAPGNVSRIYDGYIIGSVAGAAGAEEAVAVPVQTLIMDTGRSITTRYSGKN